MATDPAASDAASEFLPSVAMPTDDQIVAELNKLLEGVDWDNTTERMVRHQLETKLGVSLSSKKQLISKEIDKYMNANQDRLQAGNTGEQGDPEAASEADEDAEVEEERPSKRKGKKSGEHRKRKAADTGDEPKKARKQAHCLLSPELAAFLGVETLPRFQVVKEIWVYIKANNLQDPSNRRQILCDDKMKTIFKPPIDMFSMNKQLSNHIKNANQTT